MTETRPLLTQPPNKANRTSRSSSRLWLLQLFSLIGKEFKEIRRDPSSWLVAFILPLIFLLLFGYGITLDAGRLPVAILNQSGGQASLGIVSDFANSPWFTVIPAKDMDSAGRMMSDSEIQGIVVIRETFDLHLDAGRTADIQVLIDGSEPNIAQFIRQYTEGVIKNGLATSAGSENNMPINPIPRIWYNPTAKSEMFLVPGSITVIMTLIGTLLTSLVFAREWERGTMEALIASPVSKAQILLGKLVPYFCMGMAGMSLCVFLSVTLFGIPLRGSLGSLLLVSSIFMCCALGQGLLISVSLKGQLVCAEAGLFTGFLPALLLSGFVFDIESMPFILQCLTKILPATYFNTCIRTLFLAGDYWDIFTPALVYMGILGTVMLGLVYIKLPRHLPKS